MKLRLTHILYIIAVALTLPLTAGCGGKSTKGNGERLKVVVSIPPQARLLEEIAGDSVEIITLAEADVNPETFEMTVGAHRSLAQADLFFMLDAFQFEKAVAKNLPESVRVVENGERVERLYGTHEHPHDHNEVDHDGAADPHIWTSVRNMKQMAVTMADGLIAADPSRAEYYATRRDRLTGRLDSLDRAITARLDSAGSPAFMIWHPSMSYFAADYGLNQIAVGAENKEMSVKQLRDRIDRANAADAKVLLLQTNFDNAQAANVAAAVELDTLTINLLAPDWENQLIRITDVLCR